MVSASRAKGSRISRYTHYRESWSSLANRVDVAQSFHVAEVALIVLEPLVGCNLHVQLSFDLTRFVLPHS